MVDALKNDEVEVAEARLAELEQLPRFLTEGERRQKRDLDRALKKGNRRGNTVTGRGRMKLTVPGIPSGMKAAWVNDDGTSIRDAMDAGYRMATKQEVGPVGEDTGINNDHSEGNQVSRVVTRAVEGEPAVTAHLMLIPISMWTRRKEAIAYESDQRIASLKRGGHVPGGGQEARSLLDDPRFFDEGTVIQ